MFADLSVPGIMWSLCVPSVSLLCVQEVHGYSNSVILMLYRRYY